MTCTYIRFSTNSHGNRTGNGRGNCGPPPPPYPPNIYIQSKKHKLTILVMYSKVLIANRGVIVARILRTLKKLGIKSVVVYAEADHAQPYIRAADEAYSLGSGSSTETYLNTDLLISIAHESGAQAIHPGYGFLSENAAFIERCEAEGMAWLGPTAEQVRQFGYKHKARELAAAAGVPLVPGTGLLYSFEEAKAQADSIGYPVILKSTAGGGGIGMTVCNDEKMLKASFDSVRQLSTRNFGDGNVFLEAFVSQARHIEVQIFGDGNGEVVSVGERDCSTQRRNQKVVEECPAPAISELVRSELHRTAIELGKLVKYRSAGTIEFIYDSKREKFYFLEVNTRLQVEHGVTEVVWGVDLVEWMILLGSHSLSDLLPTSLTPKGHAIQVRVYAEDPAHDFRPSAGLLSNVELVASDPAKGIRVDSTIETGSEVSPFFDPMLAKFIKWAPDRNRAISGLVSMLYESHIYGIVTNKDWLQDVLRNENFMTPTNLSTRWLNTFYWTPSLACEILKPGTFTTIQDFPGRQGYWDVGVPPSGAFDNWSFQLGNKFLGNPESASGLEITVSGPVIRFYDDTEIVVAGAPVPIRIQSENGNREVQTWEIAKICKGDILDIGKVPEGKGMRAYLLVKDGFSCPAYLGSCSTFTLGQFGGHCGRQLRTGDRLGLCSTISSERDGNKLQSATELAPIDTLWEIRVLYGPHGSPEFFLDEDIQMFFAHEWEVHYNSSRTGVRLVGPRPQWARSNGGEAGLHPSNLHDNAYAFGAVDFTGDMPIILGPDGPSLGGFVCPAVLIKCDRWKMGQLAPGNKVKFIPVSLETARELDEEQQLILSDVVNNEARAPQTICQIDMGSPIVKKAKVGGIDIVYRRAGDDFLLIEFGPMELHISLRFRAHAWMLWLQNKNLAAIIDLTPGIRSLQIHYDPFKLTLTELMTMLAYAEVELAEVEDLELDTREVYLPLSWNDEACQKAIDHYQKSVRPNAPWCPSNLEFIRRINGLSSIKDVQKIVFSAKYLVMGLGDVYLGAPVATPLDPRRRLVTTKYNPARTWTAENSVGIGGSYLCVYGMEGPGGYQFVGRTLQMWNRYYKTEFFQQPWLLRFFDQLRFYPVSHDELMKIRQDFPQGRFPLKVKPTKFKLADYLASLESETEEIAEFRHSREAAFEDEIAMWHAKGLFTFEDREHEKVDSSASELVDGESSVDASVSGSVWKVLVKKGDRVQPEQPLIILESMKMEFNVVSETAGVVSRVLAKEGAMVVAGQPVVTVIE